jgi:hypothetical protein
MPYIYFSRSPRANQVLGTVERENTLERMNKEECYNEPIDGHCCSKLLNIFGVRELASRTSCDEVFINFFNSGAVDTWYV